MKYKIIDKKKNETTIIDNISSDEVYEISRNSTKLKTHLCWEHCSPDLCNSKKCPKVFDIIKHNIDDYSFINEGFQIIKETGEMTHFIVTDCELYNNSERAKVKVKK